VSCLVRLITLLALGSPSGVNPGLWTASTNPLSSDSNFQPKAASTTFISRRRLVAVGEQSQRRKRMGGWRMEGVCSHFRRNLTYMYISSIVG
jgi:hypothetical protein